MKIFFAILTVLSVLLSFNCSGDTLQVTEGWARAAAEGDKTTLYFLIQNHSKEPDVLRSIDATAGTAQMYEMTMVDGVTTPQPINRIAIAVGKDLRLKPDGRYVQLSGLKQALVAGATIHINLNFEKAGTISQSIIIQPANSTHFED